MQANDYQNLPGIVAASLVLAHTVVLTMSVSTSSTLAEIGLLLYGPGNQSHLAQALGISLSSLQRMMRQEGQQPFHAAGGLVIERKGLCRGATSPLPTEHEETLLRLLQRKRDQIDELVWMLTLDKVGRELEEDEKGKCDLVQERA